MADPFTRQARAAARLPFRRRTARAHVGQQLYDRLMGEIDACDHALLPLVQQRRELAQRLTDLAEHYWPRLEAMQGYRPPIADDLPLPDAVPEPYHLSGELLRSVVLTLLRHHGECRLYTMHCLLLTYGFIVDSRTPVKALADALGYEVRQGRAVRVRRGVYAVHPRFSPKPGRFGATSLAPPTPWISPRVDAEDLPSASAWT